jgi:hypothetical protein
MLSVSLFPKPAMIGFFVLGKISFTLANSFIFSWSGAFYITSRANDLRYPSGLIRRGPGGSLKPSK